VTTGTGPRRPRGARNRSQRNQPPPDPARRSQNARAGLMAPHSTQSDSGRHQKRPLDFPDAMKERRPPLLHGIRRRRAESLARWSRQGESLVPAVAAKASTDLPEDHPNRRRRLPLLRLRELCHDSRQRDIRPREPFRQHESRLLIRVDDDSHWMGRDRRVLSQRCPMTSKIPRCTSLTCEEESVLSIFGRQRVRFARFVGRRVATRDNEVCPSGRSGDRFGRFSGCMNVSASRPPAAGRGKLSGRRRRSSTTNWQKRKVRCHRTNESGPVSLNLGRSTDLSQ
jgi:hypothetical protein